MKPVLGRPFGDATSGLYAVNAKALPLLAEPFRSGAPEVEALIRVREAGLRLEEVPVNMAERASGESKLRGSKALKLVLTVAGTLLRARRAFASSGRGAAGDASAQCIGGRAARARPNGESGSRIAGPRPLGASEPDPYRQMRPAERVERGLRQGRHRCSCRPEGAR